MGRLHPRRLVLLPLARQHAASPWSLPQHHSAMVVFPSVVHQRGVLHFLHQRRIQQHSFACKPSGPEPCSCVSD